MSKPRYGWWSYVKYIIRKYPEHKEKREAVKAMRTTADYSGQPHIQTLDGVFSAAMRGLPKNEEREYQAVREAITETRDTPAGSEVLKLVRIVFWERTHTLSGAAAECHISFNTAQRWHARFIKRVAKYMGFLEDPVINGVKKPK